MEQQQPFSMVNSLVTPTGNISDDDPVSGATGYGGFAMSASPFFSPILLSFMQTYGAVLALPNIRGGGEFGEQWHRGGRRENKVC